MGKGSKGMALLVLMSPVDAHAGRILAVFMLVFNIFQPRSCRAASARGHEKLERSCLRIPCGFLTQLLISIQSGASRVDGRLTDMTTLGICPPFCFFSPALHAPVRSVFQTISPFPSIDTRCGSLEARRLLRHQWRHIWTERDGETDFLETKSVEIKGQMLGSDLLVVFSVFEIYFICGHKRCFCKFKDDVLSPGWTQYPPTNARPRRRVRRGTVAKCACLAYIFCMWCKACCFNMHQHGQLRTGCFLMFPAFKNSLNNMVY